MLIDYIESSLKNIFRNKKNKILIAIITLLLFILFIDIIFMKNIYGYMYEYTIKNVDFRSFNAYNFSEKSESEKIAELKKVKHISDAYNAKYSNFPLTSDIHINDVSGDITILHPISNSFPKSIEGKKVGDLKSGEMICPYNFYPNEGASLYKIDDSKIITPKEIIDKEFNVFYLKIYHTNNIVNGEREEIKETLSKKFKIVGFYDNTTIMNYTNECYGIEEDIKIFVDTLNPTREKKAYTYRIVVDKPFNLNKVKKEIKKLGYEISDSAIIEFDKPTIAIIVSISTSIFIVITFTIIYLLYSYIKKKIKIESKYIGIIRACGYTKNQVINEQLIENSMILLISFIISSIIFSISFAIIEPKVELFKAISYVGFKVSNNIFLLFIILLFIILFSLLINIKILKSTTESQITKLLGDE